MEVEKRTVGTRKKYYLAQSKREKGKVTKVRIFLGTNLTADELAKIRPGAEERFRMKLYGEPQQRKFKNIRLVGFDFDGTLVYYPKFKSAFEVADDLVGSLYYDRKLYTLYERGKISISKWTELTFRRYRERGLTKKTLDRAFRLQMRLMPGVKTLFAELKKRNIKIVIISGGLKNSYDAFVDKFGIEADFVRMAHELKFDRKGRFIGGNYSEYDYEGKIEALRETCEDLGIGLKNCAFVGDWQDDIPIFRKVGLPIAINTRNPRVLKAAKFSIKSRDVRRIMDYM